MNKAEHNKLIYSQELAGYITVKPPKGECFNIILDEDTDELFICKKRKVFFFAKNLTENGRIAWLVKSSNNSFYTKVTWPTPYRVGSIQYLISKKDSPPKKF